MTTWRTVILMAAICLIHNSALAANIVPVYADGANEGYNSNSAPDSVSADDGAVGDTLGEQRRWAFEKAAEFWALRLQSPVEIRVQAKFDSLFCESGSAILGQAGANGSFSFSSGASPHPIAETWYPQALVDRFTGTDNNSGNPDILSTFNSDIDSGCFSGGTWYYALGTPPANKISFFETVVHEIAHGLGFATLVNLQTGERAEGNDMVERDDVYMVFLEDHSAGMDWPDLTNGQRAASAENTDDLHWVGAEVVASLGDIDDGFSNGHPEMYAPASLEPGSSVSHWDTDVSDTSNREDMMAPFATENQKLLLTDDLLHDIGWNDFSANNCPFSQDRLTVTGTLTGSNNHNACISITFDGADIQSDSTSVLAGQIIIIQNGFTVQSGATFTANTDPSIGL